MNPRILLGSTAIHVGVACGIGLWVGGFGAPPRADVQFSLALEQFARPPQLLVEPRDEVVPPAAQPTPTAEPTIPEVAVPPPTAVEFAPDVDPNDRLPDVPSDGPWPLLDAVAQRVIVRSVEPERDVPDETLPAPTESTSAPVVPAFVEAVAERERNIPPVYPAESVRRGETGVVVMRLTIGADGAVVRAELARSSGFPRLDRAALSAAEDWIFEPARRDGAPTESQKLESIGFEIR